MKKIAIMQPTYLPWLGYFGLMDSVDLFVYLDCVQFSKRSWQQRNQIKTSNGAQWLTVPVLSRSQRHQKICDTRIDLEANFIKKHSRSIESNYSRSSFFDDYFPKIKSAYTPQGDSLLDLNIALIDIVRECLGLTTPCVMASSLGNIEGKNADLLVSICRSVDADQYLSPPGSAAYLEQSTAFTDAEIELKYFDFSHPLYPQLHGDFLPYMSTIDLLFNCGPASYSVVHGALRCEA